MVEATPKPNPTFKKMLDSMGEDIGQLLEHTD